MAIPVLQVVLVRAALAWPLVVLLVVRAVRLLAVLLVLVALRVVALEQRPKPVVMALLVLITAQAVVVVRGLARLRQG